jgi:hypothetical protein
MKATYGGENVCIASRMMDCNEALRTAQVDALKGRLQIDPGGSDKIDEFEMAMQFLERMGVPNEFVFGGRLQRHDLDQERLKRSQLKILYDSACEVNRRLQSERELLLDRVKRALLGIESVCPSEPNSLISRENMEIKDMHGFVLEFLGNRDDHTQRPQFSFECGVLAALDWIQNIDSVYAQAIDRDMTTYLTNEEGEE